MRRLHSGNGKKRNHTQIKIARSTTFDVMMTDLGCEFSAVSKDGIVFRNAGMLLSTKTEGHMPEWWGGEVSDKKLYEGMVENYLNELPIIPWNQVAQDDLVELLNEIENLEGNEE